MTETLKPCPFCGKPAAMLHERVYCRNEDCSQYGGFKVAAWNCRERWPYIAALEAQQDRLLKLCKEVADPEPCTFDDRGLCQIHYGSYSSGRELCIQKRLLDAIAAVESEGGAA